ncbi:MAG TPA: hypothetical protein VFK81_16445, partial [Terriglobales bacterium]|nr:hypothetical protein [Terriglobales bacterium]
LRTVVQGELRSLTGRARTGTLEVGWSMQLPQILLAVLCVALGVAPGLAFVFLQQAIASTPPGAGSLLAQPMPAGAFAGLTGPQGAALFVPLAVLGVLGATFLIAFTISRLGSAPRRAAAPWLCGYAPEAECERYIAHNFYGEIKRHFQWLGGAHDGKPVVMKGRAS